MPMYDFRCSNGHTFESLVPVGTQRICCVECPAPADKVWLSSLPTRVRGDECDFVQENGLPHPVRIRSWSQYRRLMKQHGCEPAVRHVGVPGTDKSPHTTSWAAISPQTLADAKSMLERNAKVKSAEAAEDELDAAVESGETGMGVSVGNRLIDVRVGRVYAGVVSLPNGK